ncbi:hypothetical protein ACEWY4_010938 [Coilia grayii]|uniref:Uncharacterized protein n=1 Tax=Coilia grayii TaxID=363190 RepID=A0ABD1K3A3_9TELE
MHGTAPPAGGDQHEQAVSSALDLICSSSEQTYTQFLASFTQLIPEASRSQAGRNTLEAVAPETRRDGRGRDEDSNQRGRPDAPDLPELSESQRKATFVEEDNRGDSQVSSLLPGVVEEEGLAAPPSSITRSTKLEMSSTTNTKPSTSSATRCPATGTTTAMAGGDHTTHSPSLPLGEHTLHSASSDAEMQRTQMMVSDEQVDWEEVQPFRLDEDFDYDHVVLTHKFPTLQQNPTAN